MKRLFKCFGRTVRLLYLSGLCGFTARSAMVLAWCFTSISHPGDENTRRNFCEASRVSSSQTGTAPSAVCRRMLPMQAAGLMLVAGLMKPSKPAAEKRRILKHSKGLRSSTTSTSLNGISMNMKRLRATMCAVCVAIVTLRFCWHG